VFEIDHQNRAVTVHT